MGHWEQIGERNRYVRALGLSATGWRKALLYTGIFGASAVLWTIMLWPLIRVSLAIIFDRQ